MLRKVNQQSIEVIFLVAPSVNTDRRQSEAAAETIPCRKWGYGSSKGQTVTVAAVVGPQKISTFDHLFTASLDGGFYAKYRAAPPQNSLVVATGSKPYVGFHYAKEGFTQPVLTDIARVATSLIKSALPSWLTGKQQNAETPTAPSIPTEPMVCRFGLCDLTRHGMNIWLSPKDQLCAVADNLGRVVLVDCKKAVALRIWKGYREAQCCFVEVAEKLQKNQDKNERKRAQFLVIYAPRRQCIEVWSLQRGPKVATFAAPRYGNLLQFNHGLMGVMNTAKMKSAVNMCLFLDPTDNLIKEITIPFHCANINDANSKTAKDLHLYKRLKLCLRNADTISGGEEQTTVGEVSQICQEIETEEMINQAIDLLAGNKKTTPEILKAGIAVIGEKLAGDRHVTNEDEEDILRVLRIKCENYLRLVDFYLNMTTGSPTAYEVPREREEVDAESKPTDSETEKPVLRTVDEKMQIFNYELETIQKLIDLSTLDKSTANNGPKVTFGEKTKPINSFHEYLSIFYVGGTDQILLRTDKIALYETVGSTIFGPYLSGKNCTQLCELMQRSEIACDDLLRLFLYTWAGRPFAYTSSDELINDMSRFYAVLRQICIYAGERVVYEYNSLSRWWQSVREFLLDSACALRGLLAAFVCRNVALHYQGSCDPEDETFEEVSQEACQWTLLITRLDDIAVLGAILKNQIKSADAFLPPMTYNYPEVSLREILRGGKGIVTELVAKWLTASEINPQKLVEIKLEDTEASTSHLKETLRSQTLTELDPAAASDEGKKAATRRSNLPPELYCLEILRDHFPFSLQSKAILCQLVWDYMSQCSRNLPDLHLMRAGIECLKVFRDEDQAVKHGVMIMVWNAHLKITLKAAKSLIDKTGRLPKERICLQDIGISDSLVPQFLEYCREFMDEFIKSAAHSKVEVKFEELLIDDADRMPLILLALEQGVANVELLKLHAELLQVLHIIAFFNLKCTKPIQTLFNGMQNMSFFADIKKPLSYDLPEADLILKKDRLEFLCKITTASVDLIREDQNDVYLVEHKQWMEQVYELADRWRLNSAEIKEHQVHELSRSIYVKRNRLANFYHFQILQVYAHGWDGFAEDLMEQYLDVKNIGSPLLSIAAQRLSQYTRKDHKALQIIAGAGSILFDYMDVLHITEQKYPVSMQTENSINKLMSLSEKVFHLLSKQNSKELRIAGMLLDAVATIKESNA